MITNRAIQTIQHVQDQPFFIAVGFYKPHMPFNAPQKYWNLYSEEDLEGPAVTELPEGISGYSFRRWKEYHNYDGVPQIPNGTPLPDSVARHLRHGYYAAVSYVDTQIGKIVEELEKAGLSDNTIIAIWGDHGWKLGKYSAWSKHTLYEIDTQVPLVVYALGQPFGKTDAIVELIDLYPTFVELAGLPTPEGIQGTSVSYFFDDPEAMGKEVALSQFIRNAEGTYTTYEESIAKGQSVRTDRFRLIQWIIRDKENTSITGIELYDHYEDPEETVNVAGEEKYVGTVNRLMKIADEQFKEPSIFD